MTKKKTDLSPKQRIATLEKRIAAKVSPKSKVEDEKGNRLGSVTVRHKALASGELRLYLDVYRDGKRHCYFLKTLDPALVVSTDDAGEYNENAISEAEAKRLAFANDMKAGNDLTKKAAIYSKMLLKEWLDEHIAKAKRYGRSAGFRTTLLNMKRKVLSYRGDQVTLKDVDKEFCEGFLLFMANDTSKDGKAIAKATQAQYFKLFKMALQAAVEDGKITENPATKVNKNLKPKVPESTRAYLEVEELKAMIETPCKCERVKTAYIFCCFCGLRYSDVSALTWGDILTKNGEQWIDINMIKTGERLQVPLSEEAIKWLPARGTAKAKDRIFRVPTINYTNIMIKEWAKAAGVTKHLSFHTSRHTFATLELTAGADVYTTSKLLGHTNVTTTQIYAKIIDEKKAKAVNLVSNLFND